MRLASHAITQYGQFGYNHHIHPKAERTWDMPAVNDSTTIDDTREDIVESPEAGDPSASGNVVPDTETGPIGEGQVTEESSASPADDGSIWGFSLPEIPAPESWDGLESIYLYSLDKGGSLSHFAEFSHSGGHARLITLNAPSGQPMERHCVPIGDGKQYDLLREALEVTTPSDWDSVNLAGSTSPTWGGTATFANGVIIRVDGTEEMPEVMADIMASMSQIHDETFSVEAVANAMSPDSVSHIAILRDSEKEIMQFLSTGNGTDWNDVRKCLTEETLSEMTSGGDAGEESEPGAWWSVDMDTSDGWGIRRSGTGKMPQGLAALREVLATEPDWTDGLTVDVTDIA